jgi:putative DNA primase/helicase
MQRKAEDIAPGNWEDILKDAGMGSEYFTYREGPCPICAGNTRFRWKAKEEIGFCNHCRLLSGFALLQHFLCGDFKDAANFIRKWGGYDTGNDSSDAPRPLRVAKPPPPPVDEAKKKEYLRSKYQKLWSEGRPVVEGDPVYKYLHARIKGLTSIPRTIRCHPGLEYFERSGDNGDKYVCTGTHPALLAAVQGPDGNATNVWRIYLNADGSKLDVTDAKKAAGAFLKPGGSVRLQEPTGDELGIAEGIENALAVIAIFDIPCWSTLNAGEMSKFEIPAGYEHITKFRIFGDNDSRDKNGRRAGNDNAKALQTKLRDLGKTATILMPKFTNFDFVDISKNK